MDILLLFTKAFFPPVCLCFHNTKTKFLSPHTLFSLLPTCPPSLSLTSENSGANAVSALLIIGQQGATGAANNPRQGQAAAPAVPETQPGCPLLTNLEERHSRQEPGNREQIDPLDGKFLFAKYFLAFLQPDKCLQCLQ